MRARGKLTPIRAVNFIVILALVTGLFALTAAAFGDTSQPAQPSPLGAGGASRVSDVQATGIDVEGWVKDSAELPVSGAAVTMGSERALSDSSGHFSFVSAPPASTTAPSAGDPTSLDVSVSASGFAAWSISRVRYYPGDVLRLYPHLESAGHAATHLSASQPKLSHGPESLLAPGASSIAGYVNSPSAFVLGPRNPLSVDAAGSAPPAQIRVYRTATGQVEVVPFKDYVKHVLPNEWVSSWAPDSLRAGAMAVKEYAWFWVAQGGKEPSLGADVKDNTDDQVYDPNVSYASTDAAVDATWQYSMTRNGALFQASYCAGSYQADPSVDCPWDGNYMTQWGSKYYADQGYTWPWILRFYYPGSVVTPNPPGGNGGPIPTQLPTPPSHPAPVSNNYTVGEGADQPQVFQAAYDRNGGEAVLGRPTGTVHWWLQFLSDKNVLAQPFSGADGLGNSWLVYDTLKSNLSGISRAYMISGDIAKAYASHQPPGPEWVGAPTSDPYPSSADTLGQGFTNGNLAVNGQVVQFTPWPTQFNGWEGDYFVGKPPSSLQTGPLFNLPGQPSNVADVAQPDMDWTADAGMPEKLGVGKADWAAQFTRILQVEPGTYDFVLTADSGVRLWVDGLLAVNAWTATGSHTETYNADLDATQHTIRIQYFSPSSTAQMHFSMAKRVQGEPVAAPPPAAQSPGGSAPSGSASLRISVQWLGRGDAPSDAWVQPLTLLLSNPGNPAIIGTYSGTTDRNGVVIYSNLPAGMYDIHVKGAHELQSARASIGLTSSSVTDVDMKAMVEGDIYGDNCVTIDDFAIVQAMVGTDKNTPGYDPRADLNGDGQVTLADVSLLRSGFDRCGDISADNDFQALSTGGSPPNSEDLSPWLNPDALQKNLTLDLYAGAPTVKKGDVFQVEVVANAGSQPIDGGSFLLHYDPTLLAPVDTSGNPASLSEPGLALPSVLTNWVDGKGGAIGYAASIMQGPPPSGQVVLTTLNFKALRAGQTALNFAPLSSSYMELTNGGVNLLSASHDLTLTVTP